MSTPPTLPISNPTTMTTTTDQSQPPIATPAFRAFITRITDTVLLLNGLSQRRPWSELEDRSAFTRPESLTEAASRVRKNFTYFRVNYLTLIASVLAISLLTNPFSLLVLVTLLAAWLFLYLFRPSDQPLVILGRTFTDRETLGSLIVLTAVVVFLTLVGSVLMSALVVGLAIVCAHGSFRVPEDLVVGAVMVNSLVVVEVGERKSIKNREFFFKSTDLDRPSDPTAQIYVQELLLPFVCRSPPGSPMKHLLTR